MKRDLNLVPRAESQSSANKFILPIMLIVVLYAATAYLAITIPQQQLHTKEAEYNSIKQKVLDLEYVEVEYQALRSQITEIEAKKETISQTKPSDKDAVIILSLIEGACPEDIMLTDVLLTEDGIIIEGTAETDSLVAEFMVNLRAIELFAYSNISKVMAVEATFADLQQAQVDGTEVPTTRYFELALAYPSAEIVAEVGVQ